MLKSLYIENIAVIEKTSVEFGKGFNVLTGETGAGKSILIDAINAVLGERTSKELIRAGCKNAVVTAVFSSLSDSVKSDLTENGFYPDEYGEYTVRRVLSDTSGSIKINGQPVSATVLRSFAGKLINIHGQHDNQMLLQPENHYMYIDALANNPEILNAYTEEFKHFNSVRAKLKKLDIDEEEKLRKIDLLKYQINELKTADIKIGEIKNLKEDLEIAKNSEKHKQSAEDIFLLLNGNDSNNGIIADFTQILRIIEKQNLNELKNSEASLEIAYDTLLSLKSKTEDYIDELNSGTYAIDTIQDRLELLYSLMRKYGNSEEKMIEYLNTAEAELKMIEFNDNEILQLEKELEISQDRLIKYAEELTVSRKNTAQKFDKNVSEVLKQLNMPNIKFYTEFKKGRYSKIGCDEIQFLISANAGETLKPLSKVASGGELSRIMLAIKSVLSKNDDVDTLIFDEIDSGISGIAADKVGEQLKNVAQYRQVICVTHLAQIAAFAKHHYLIHKSIVSDKTYTEVEPLGTEARIKEIARIMGGSNITESLLASAEELLKTKL